MTNTNLVKNERDQIIDVNKYVNTALLLGAIGIVILDDSDNEYSDCIIIAKMIDGLICRVDKYLEGSNSKFIHTDSPKKFNHFYTFSFGNFNGNGIWVDDYTSPVMFTDKTQVKRFLDTYAMW